MPTERDNTDFKDIIKVEAGLESEENFSLNDQLNDESTQSK